MQDKKFPESKKRSNNVRLPSEMLAAIEEFLKIDIAKSMGLRCKSDVVTAAVLDLFDKYCFKMRVQDASGQEKD